MVLRFRLRVFWGLGLGFQGLGFWGLGLRELGGEGGFRIQLPGSMRLCRLGAEVNGGVPLSGESRACSSGFRV